MKLQKWNLCFVVAVIAGAIGFGLFARAADPVTPAQKDGSLRIGVIDAGKIYDSMTEMKEAADSWQQAVSNLTADRQKRQQEIAGLQQQILQFREDSPQWNDIFKQIAQKSAALKTLEELLPVELQRLQKASLKSAHRHVVEASEKVAKARNLNLMLSDSNPDLSTSHTEPFSAGQFKQLILSRAVFYSDAKADFTQEVLTTLEADYAARKQGAK